MEGFGRVERVDQLLMECPYAGPRAEQQALEKDIANSNNDGNKSGSRSSRSTVSLTHAHPTSLIQRAEHAY